MRLLLDTHIVYWNYYEPRRIPERARELMLKSEAVFISSVSIWEIAIKARLGKINADPKSIFQRIGAAGFHELPVLARHAVVVADLPLHHSDPFDRLLIAQALSEPLYLLTVDAVLSQYGEIVIQV
jgi:PIN domain nuclease of toxin-antitoxin system